ncbi:MAG TPA: urease accessory UreF family protein [Jatrophihabitans sp.]|jgi:urease accessory protein
MTMHASAEVLLMLLADARLPVAGHTQSAGLEPAVTAGLAAGQVPDYLATRLATVTRVEAATAVVALHRLHRGLALEPVEAAWAARTPSAAMRRTSRVQAKALLRLLTHLNGPAAHKVGPCRAVVLATAATGFGLSAMSLARLIGYDDVQTVASAALKLMPLDPAATTRWVYDALPSVDALARDVAALTEPEEIPVAGAPQIEAWAEAHAVASRRLFSA